MGQQHLFQLGDSRVTSVQHVFRLLVDPVIGVQFFLQLDYRLVSFVQTGRQGDHYVSLLQKQLFVPIHLCLVLLDLLSLLLQLAQFVLVLLPNDLLLLL